VSAGVVVVVVMMLDERSEMTELISTGEAEGAPCKVGVAATDIATGLYAHGAIMAGLLSRQQTGKGMWIDCNLFETQVGEGRIGETKTEL